MHLVGWLSPWKDDQRAGSSDRRQIPGRKAAHFERIVRMGVVTISAGLRELMRSLPDTFGDGWASGPTPPQGNLKGPHLSSSPPLPLL